MNRIAVAITLLFLAACSDPAGPDMDAWRFAGGTDNISGVPWAQAVSSNTLYGMSLIVRCRERRFDVIVQTPFILESDRVRYRVGSGQGHESTWSPSTDFKAVFYPGNARTFAESLVGQAELLIEVRQIGEGPRQASFRVGGLNNHLPRIIAACT